MYFNLLAVLDFPQQNLEDIDFDINDDVEVDSKDKKGGATIFKMLSVNEAHDRNSSSQHKHEIWFNVKNFKHSTWDLFLPMKANAFGSGKSQRKERIQFFFNEILNPYLHNKQITDTWLDQNLDLLEDHITIFLEKIKQLHIVGYSELDFTGRLTDMTEVFVRINQGVKLTKLDLLFSTLVANWEEGRNAIKELQDELKYGGYAKLDLEFILRTCLYLSEGNVLFNLKSFKNSTVSVIQQNFKKNDGTMDFRTAILQMVVWLKDQGISESILSSKNVLIPLVYHLYKGGELTSLESQEEANKFIFVSLLNKIFGSHGDSLLSNLRRNAKNQYGELKNIHFNVNALVHDIAEQIKRILYQVTEDTIDQWLEKTSKKDVCNILYLSRDINNEYQNACVQILHPDKMLPAQLSIQFGATQVNNWAKQACNWALIPNELSKQSTISLVDH